MIFESQEMSYAYCSQAMLCILQKLFTSTCDVNFIKKCFTVLLNVVYTFRIHVCIFKSCKTRSVSNKHCQFEVYCEHSVDLSETHSVTSESQSILTIMLELFCFSNHVFFCCMLPICWVYCCSNYQ